MLLTQETQCLVAEIGAGSLNAFIHTLAMMDIDERCKLTDDFIDDCNILFWRCKENEYQNILYTWMPDNSIFG